MLLRSTIGFKNRQNSNVLLMVLLTMFANLGCNKISSSAAYPEKPKVSSKPSELEIRESADFLRDISPDLVKPLMDPALTAVTTEFGFSNIPMSTLPFRSAAIQAEMYNKEKFAWSSWWYPKSSSLLFEGAAGEGPSTLAKYDEFRKSYQLSAGSATAFERAGFNPRSLSWEGLCDAWALASILSPEPKRSARFQVGSQVVTFSVADMKALILKTYEGVDDSALKYYGQKFMGNEKSWIYPDIFPEQFHRFVEVQIMQKREPFIMDHDAGVEVWNVPVYKANYNLTAVADDPDAVMVTMWLYSAEQAKLEERNFVGTREAVREYNYVLKGTRDTAGNLQATSGYWTKGASGVDSRKSHPDYLARVVEPKQITRKSWNSEIQKDVVDKITESAF
jgi:hypothetical protein